MESYSEMVLLEKVVHRLAQMAEARARLTAPCRHSAHETTTNQRVLREYTGGWLQCADETPPAAGAGQSW